tara:strand:+ start:489 stop:785 length:297 start_codon:yes stop_codon:yes gene_type:complete
MDILEDQMQFWTEERKNVYKIPCGWEVYGYVEVSAGSLDEAIKKVEADNYFPLPNRTVFGKVKGDEPHMARFNYVEGTFEIDDAIIEGMSDGKGDKHD